MGRLRRCRTALGRYRHSKGFGIHSPFAFRFVLNVLRERNPYYAYEMLDALRHSVIAHTRHNLRHPRIISLKNAKMIFRVTNYFNPVYILQIGTSYGISSVSMLSVSSRTRLTLCEAHLGDYAVAHDVLGGYMDRISLHDKVAESIEKYKAELMRATDDKSHKEILDAGWDVFSDRTALPFVLVNNIYDEEEYVPALSYIKEIMASSGVVIMRNLSRNKQMQAMWQECRRYATYGMAFSNEKVAIIVANPKLPRQDFSMWF